MSRTFVGVVICYPHWPRIEVLQHLALLVVQSTNRFNKIPGELIMRIVSMQGKSKAKEASIPTVFEVKFFTSL